MQIRELLLGNPFGGRCDLHPQLTASKDTLHPTRNRENIPSRHAIPLSDNYRNERRLAQTAIEIPDSRLLVRHQMLLLRFCGAS